MAKKELINGAGTVSKEVDIKAPATITVIASAGSNYTIEGNAGSGFVPLEEGIAITDEQFSKAIIGGDMKIRLNITTNGGEIAAFVSDSEVERRR